LELLRFYIPGGIVVKWDGPLTSRFIRADVNQMYQMLMNLCVNAAHAMENGGELKISLTETELDADSVPPGCEEDEICPGLYVRLEVSDTGAGIDQATLERIFEPLLIAKEFQEGIGLGLPVVQRIIKNHGGLITIESTSGEKTTFVVHLPCT